MGGKNGTREEFYLVRRESDRWPRDVHLLHDESDGAYAGSRQARTCVLDLRAMPTPGDRSMVMRPAVLRYCHRTHDEV